MEALENDDNVISAQPDEEGAETGGIGESEAPRFEEILDDFVSEAMKGYLLPDKPSPSEQQNQNFGGIHEYDEDEEGYEGYEGYLEEGSYPPREGEGSEKDERVKDYNQAELEDEFERLMGEYSDDQIGMYIYIYSLSLSLSFFLSICVYVCVLHHNVITICFSSQRGV